MEKLLPLALFVLLFANTIKASAQDKHNFIVPPENSNCDSMVIDLPELEVALEIIGHTVFRFQQNVKINRETGFREASFFSCDNQDGYMVIKYHDSIFLYSSIPKSIWESMVSSGNPGVFYEQNIRGSFVTWLSQTDSF
jgi:hypothetical protein